VTVRGVAACLALSCALAGCGTTGSGSSSSNTSVTATGSTLSIWVSEPPHATAAEQDVLDAERLAFDTNRQEVTRVSLRYRPAAKYELSANARTAIQDKSAIAYLGELAPGSSEDTLGITNALDLLQVSPTDNAVEETQSTAGVPGSPGRYYETLSTYGHTFAQLAPSTQTEAAAEIAEMKKLGVGSLYVTDDGSDYGKAIAAAVRHDAGSASITLAASASGAGAEFDGWDGTGSPPAAPSGTAKLFLPSAAALAGKLSGLSAPGGVYVSVPSPAAGGAAQVSSFDKRFQAEYGHAPAPEAVFGYEAMSAVLSVLQQAGGAVKDRSTVVRDFHRISGRSSVLGSYSIDKSGASGLASFRFMKLKGGTLVPLGGAPVQG
jgi:ABC-type branched-subunit amino acid transport system substrate-binding protein